MFSAFLREANGTMAVEYGLILAILSVSIIGGASMIGNNVDDRLTTLATNIQKP